jgi:hypothetical protein
MIELVVFIGGFIAGTAMTLVIATMSIEFYKNEIRK